MNIPVTLSDSELLDLAMTAATQAEADGCFECVVGRTMAARGDGDRDEAERIARDNLGYWAGYHDHETRRRVERLYRAHHPILGPLAVSENLTAREIFEIGVDVARHGFRDRRPEEET